MESYQKKLPKSDIEAFKKLASETENVQLKRSLEDKIKKLENDKDILK